MANRVCSRCVIFVSAACDSGPCQNNATCIDRDDGSFACLCSPSFTGFFCEESSKFSYFVPVTVPQTNPGLRQSVETCDITSHRPQVHGFGQVNNAIFVYFNSLIQNYLIIAQSITPQIITTPLAFPIF